MVLHAGEPKAHLEIRQVLAQFGVRCGLLVLPVRLAGVKDDLTLEVHRLHDRTRNLSGGSSRRTQSLSVHMKYGIQHDMPTQVQVCMHNLAAKEGVEAEQARAHGSPRGVLINNALSVVRRLPQKGDQSTYTQVLVAAHLPRTRHTHMSRAQTQCKMPGCIYGTPPHLLNGDLRRLIHRQDDGLCLRVLTQHPDHEARQVLGEYELCGSLRNVVGVKV